jgi:hypothetical protein
MLIPKAETDGNRSFSYKEKTLMHPDMEDCIALLPSTLGEPQGNSGLPVQHIVIPLRSTNGFDQLRIGIPVATAFVIVDSSTTYDIREIKEPSTSYSVVLSHSQVLNLSESDLLSEALLDLAEVNTYAEEAGYPVPKEGAVFWARQMLGKMYSVSPLRYEVYPTPDGEIAIDASGPKSSVITLVDRTGGVLCLVNIRGSQRSSVFASTIGLPNQFMLEALSALRSVIYIT